MSSICLIFFFSSRRRHTRFKCDWSSDVCSSDLVNDEDVNLPGFTREGLRSAQQSMVFTNAPTPFFQVDDLMATFSSRVYLLDPRLQRIGFGCFHDVGRGWRCVLDVHVGPAHYPY